MIYMCTKFHLKHVKCHEQKCLRLFDVIKVNVMRTKQLTLSQIDRKREREREREGTTSRGLHTYIK